MERLHLTGRRLRRLASLLPVTAVLVLSARHAAAGEPRYAELHYKRDPSASACADDDELRQRVASRLGYVPFRDHASLVITTHVTKQNSGFRARLTSTDADAKTSGARELASTASDCGELLESVALAISTVIDPLALTRPTEPPPPAASANEAPPTIAPPIAPDHGIAVDEPTPGPESSTPLVIEPSVGAFGAIAAAPAPSLGFTVGVAVHRSSWSIGLEGRADLPAEGSADSAARGVSTSLLLGAIVPCLRVGIVFACAVLAAGVLNGKGQVGSSLAQTTFYSAAGPRGGIAWELSRVVALEGYADALATLTRTELQLNDSTVWTTPVLSFGLGLRLAGRIR